MTVSDTVTTPNPPDDDLLASLTGLSQLLIGMQPLEDSLEQVAGLAARAVPGVVGVGVTTVHEGGPRTAAATSAVVLEVDQLQYDLGDGPCLDALREGSTLVTQDVAADPRWPGFGAESARRGVHAVLAVPLRLGDPDDGVVTGVLNMYAAREYPFDAERVATAELFARPAAVALENARACAGSRELVAQLEQALGSRAIIDQAIGVLIARETCTPEVAMGWLRATSQRRNVKLREVAAALVAEASGAAGR